jgi:tetratricopeptide (TPR) repeat protein
MLYKKFIPFLIIFFISLDSIAQSGHSFVPVKIFRGTNDEKARVLFNEAADNFDKKNFAAARDLYKEAISIDTNFIDAYDNLGLTYRQMNMLDSAEYYYHWSFRKDATNSTPIQNMAVVAELQNQLQKAMLLYLLVSSMDPQNPEGHFGLSRMYSLLERLPEALKSGQTAEKLYKAQNSPFLKDCYYILTIISVQMNKKKLARQYLKSAKEAGANVDPGLEKAVLNN